MVVWIQYEIKAISVLVPQGEKKIKREEKTANKTEFLS